MPSRTFQAAITALPAGATALFEHNALYVLAAVVLYSVLAVLPGLANTAARWCADKPRRDREQIGNQALSRIGQNDPERVVALLAQLPPMAHPFEREPPSVEGPAPPEPVASSLGGGDAGRVRGVGRAGNSGGG